MPIALATAPRMLGIASAALGCLALSTAVAAAQPAAPPAPPAGAPPAGAPEPVDGAPVDGKPVDGKAPPGTPPGPGAQPGAPGAKPPAPGAGHPGAGHPPPGHPPPGPYYSPYPPGPYYPPPPGYYRAYGGPPPPNPPPPAPAPRRSEAHTHDLFFLRAELSLGWFNLKTEQGRKFTGSSLMGALAIGGTPGEGIVMAGVLGTGGTLSLSGTDAAGQDLFLEEVSIQPVHLAYRVGLYPDPKAGWNGFAQLGFMGLSVQRSEQESSGDEESASGLLLGLGIGHEWWIGDEWSLGGQAQFDLGFLTADRQDVQMTYFVPALGATLTYH